MSQKNTERLKLIYSEVEGTIRLVKGTPEHLRSRHTKAFAEELIFKMRRAVTKANIDIIERKIYMDKLEVLFLSIQ